MRRFAAAVRLFMHQTAGNFDHPFSDSDYDGGGGEISETPESAFDFLPEEEGEKVFPNVSGADANGRVNEYGGSDVEPAFSDAENRPAELAENNERFGAEDSGGGDTGVFREDFPQRKNFVFWIETDKIEPNPYQPRREFDESSLRDLADSIREHGVLQPILVVKRETETLHGLEVRYQLIAGERRWRAAQMAGLERIPAVVKQGISEDRIKLELALIENVQREDLNPLERAAAFKRLMDEFQLIQREIAHRIGKSREMVSNTLRLLALAPEIQKAVGGGAISEGHARAILMVGEDFQKQIAVYNAVLAERLTVRETENKVRRIFGRFPSARKRFVPEDDPQLRSWQKSLEEKLGTRVQLQKSGERGKIVVEFYSEEELRGILDKLMKEV